MMDGQTDLMQQVVERSEPSVASIFGHMADNIAPSAPLQLPGRHHRASETGLTRPPRLSVRQIGRVSPVAVDHPEVLSLVSLLVRGQPDALDAHLEDMIRRGLPVEHIYLRLFQPAARHLGELWADDLCSFVDVTLAVSLLQSGLRHLAPRFHRHGRAAAGSRTILLATLQDEQHTLGLSMTAEFFRRSGWSVQCFSAAERREMNDRIERGPHAIVGYSVSRLDQLPHLASAIRHLRRSGRGRVAGVLVGGPVFLEHPECARDTGADGLGHDARHAVAEAEALVSLAENDR